MRRTVFLVCLLALYFGASAQTYLNQLESSEQFYALEGKPLSEKYSGTKAVKVVLDLNRNNLYFLSGKKYKYHRDFCRAVLGNKDPLARFNYMNYKSGYIRAYVFATINYYPEKKIYTLEFADIEQFSKDVLLLYRLVKEKSYIGNKLLLHPITDEQVRFIETKQENVKSISTNELYLGVSHQLLVKGSTVGRLRKIDIDTLSKTQIDPWDIVLTNGSPNDIDLCAGLIITKFQSPLSHINILCHNRGTPVLAYRDAFTDKEILAFVNKPVRLEISNTYKISSATSEELRRKIESGNRTEKKLRVDTNYKRLQDIGNISYKDVARFGGKVSNMGELFKVRRLRNTCKLPSKCFAIPMHYYKKHLRVSGGQALLDSLLKNDAILNNKTLLREQLKRLRGIIRNYPMDSSDYQLILNRLTTMEYKEGARIRFRSSTNAEDIKGFNGAGLYDSYTGVLGLVNGKTIERAIKKVWASTWNERAFRERRYFGLHQRSVCMGVLVHLAFGTEDVNGVAVTRNMFRKLSGAFTINAQKGELAIVAGKDSTTSELSILGKSYIDRTINNDYISYSSLNNERALMTKDQLRDLHESLEKIKQHYYFRIREDDTPYVDYALDVEFKIKKGLLIIKQVRPFN